MSGQNQQQFIDIYGPVDLWNDILKYVLEKEIEARCTIIDRLPPPEPEVPGAPPASLLLLDCGHGKPAVVLKELEKCRRRLPANLILALYNLQHRQGVEGLALSLGVTGIFYQAEDLGQFLKGVRALLSNQVWIPRAILAEYALNGASRKPGLPTDDNGLTRREIEILSFISLGANNLEIAEKLFISPYTVKTHLYHIFKKIGVPNRFQAALWTVKHLGEVQLPKK